VEPQLASLAVVVDRVGQRGLELPFVQERPEQVRHEHPDAGADEQARVEPADGGLRVKAELGRGQVVRSLLRHGPRPYGGGGTGSEILTRSGVTMRAFTAAAVQVRPRQEPLTAESIKANVER